MKYIGISIWILLLLILIHITPQFGKLSKNETFLLVFFYLLV